MKLTWMGRYRPFVEALVYHSNCTIRSNSMRAVRGGKKMLTQQEIQTLEFLLEFEEQDFKMTEICERLCIPQSSMSKIAKSLYERGFIERYRFEGNRKDVVLKPTEGGRQYYEGYALYVTDVFKPLFDGLSSVSDGELTAVTDAINALNDSLTKRNYETKLIKDK